MAVTDLGTGAITGALSGSDGRCTVPVLRPVTPYRVQIVATPAIGGTLNVITDPASMGRRLMVKQEFGNDGFLKTTGTLSTGLINDKFSFMGSGVRKTGDGVVEGTWTDAWAYYLAASYSFHFQQVEDETNSLRVRG